VEGESDKTTNTRRNLFVTYVLAGYVDSDLRAPGTCHDISDCLRSGLLVTISSKYYCMYIMKHRMRDDTGKGRVTCTRTNQWLWLLNAAFRQDPLHVFLPSMSCVSK
jgi:hypothetical protein